MYVEGLRAGEDYGVLCPAISICLLREEVFRATRVGHHRFQFADVERGRILAETVELHTVELAKYNVTEEGLAGATEIEKWVFFFINASGYEAERLRELLPGEGFERAISAAEAIAGRTEDRMMYDQREKAERDYRWAIESARREGVEKGREEGVRIGLEKGREVGVLVGKIQLLEQLLGQVATPTERLAGRSVEELNSLLAELQGRLRHRGR